MLGESTEAATLFSRTLTQASTAPGTGFPLRETRPLNRFSSLHRVHFAVGFKLQASLSYGFDTWQTIVPLK